MAKIIIDTKDEEITLNVTEAYAKEIKGKLMDEWKNRKLKPQTSELPSEPSGSGRIILSKEFKDCCREYRKKPKL